MKHLAAAAIVALLAGGCTARPAPVQAPPALPAAAPCAITVTFGSYAMGIDRGAFEAVEKLLARDKGVAGSEQKRWGREGEVTICVQAKSNADAARLFGEIKKLFPAKPRGPLTVETLAGARFEAGATP